MNKQDHDIFRLFANIGKHITSSLDYDDILNGVMKEVKGYFGPVKWSILRFDENTNQLFFTLFDGPMADLVKQVPLKLGEGIAGTVAATRTSIFVEDTSQDSRFTSKIDKISGFSTKSLIAVPLVFKENVYGVIEIVNRQDGMSYTEEEHLVLATIADYTAIAIHNAMIHQKILTQSMCDPLTGLYNHTKLNSVMEKYEDSNRRQRRGDDVKAHMVAVFIDLNDFKNINDVYGHREGDKVLMKTAAFLRSFFRDDDMIFRVGGDEFLALVPFQNIDRREDIVKRIIDRLTGMQILSDGDLYSVNMSFGIAFGHAYTIKELISQADFNMYSMKRRPEERG